MWKNNPGKCGVRSSLFRLYCLKGANCIDDDYYESDPAFFYESGAGPGWFLKGLDLVEFPYFTYSNRQAWANSVDSD